jgi:hypothetical protein
LPAQVSVLDQQPNLAQQAARRGFSAIERASDRDRDADLATPLMPSICSRLLGGRHRLGSVGPLFEDKSNGRSPDTCRLCTPPLVLASGTTLSAAPNCSG